MSVPSQKKEVFNKAYDDHADALFRFCLLKVSHREHALDIVQDVFVRTWQYLKEGKEIGNVRSFLYTTASHLVIDYYRKRKTESLDALAEEGFDVTDDAHFPLLTVDSEKALRAVQNLEETYRDIVLMRYVGGLSPKEIAETTGLTENVVSVRIHRGLEKLRVMLNIDNE